MTETDPTGAASARIVAQQELSPPERCYLEHCGSVSEICIVPLPNGRSASAHRHAVLVPDFPLLQKRGQPNSQELIRFEFQEASKLLAPANRPHTFSVRAKPLPRAANGEPDRERLQFELSEPIHRTIPAPRGEDHPVDGSIYRLIRSYRPAACPRNDSNLELDLDFDSLDRLLLICSVEKTLGIAIPAEQAARIFTVGDLIDVVVANGLQPARPREPAHISWAEILSQPLDSHELALANSILKPRAALSFMAWGFARLLRVIGARRFQFQVQGCECLPVHGPYLLVANHCSHLDPLFLLWAMPFGIARRASFMGHTEYFGSGWKAAIAKRLKLVPVDSDQHALEGMKLCAEALRRGLIGAVFPEAERSPNGAQQRFHRGIAVLAREMHLPIVPAAILGTYEVLPRRGQHIHSAPVQVRFGPPLCAEAAETEQDLLARVWAAVWRLRGADACSREPIPRPLACVSAHGCAE